MNSFVSNMKHPFVLGAIGLSALVVLGSVWYYRSTTRVPEPSLALMGSSTAPIITSGAVTPAQNPNLAFLSAGRVTSVRVAVGEKVGAGETLASLDTASLAAQRAQAAAQAEAARAKLDEMQAPPRSVDVAAKQTALDQAKAALNNLYASGPANIAQAYDKSFSGTSQSTDNLFNLPNSSTPTLKFIATDSAAANEAQSERALVNTELNTWKSESSALTSISSPTQLSAAFTSALAHLAVLRTYDDTLLRVLAGAVPDNNMTQSDITTAQTNVGALRDTTNSLILTLQGLEQQAQTAQFAVQSAQDALNTLNAGATAQDIEAQQAAVAAAQAQVANIDAQIHNALIVAPYSGVVSSVQVNVGDIVAPNTTAITLNPLSSLQVVGYISEADVSRITPGQAADVTLDAYGSSRHFTATVATIDHSPTMQNGVPAYRLVLQFASPDPAISSGMTANITINPAQ